VGELLDVLSNESTGMRKLKTERDFGRLLWPKRDLAGDLVEILLELALAP
jgi:hypothetical protein